ncbi:hypothetical protein D3C87_1807530 [compost metagenome]
MKDIIIVTDVVASGHSVLKIIEDIECGVQSSCSKKIDVKFHSISVISDQSIVRNEFDAKLTTIKTACGKLSMPIVRSEVLPDKEILSPRIDFTN